MFNPYSDLSERDQLTKQDIVDMWVSDLENYPELQGTGTLEQDNGKRCCLGQLCHIASLYSICKFDKSSLTYDEELTLLPCSVRKWAGLNGLDGWFCRLDEPEQHLTLLNDNGTTWLEIAKIIKSRPSGLFTW